MKILISPSHNVHINLACESYLFANLANDYVLLYRNHPAVVVGSNQVIGNEVDVEFCQSEGIAMARRMSGGGTVYHDMGNINYCFVRQVHSSTSALNADFLLPVLQSLHAMGAKATMGERKDLWLEGLKISGTASHITRGRAMYHGTLLYATNLQMLEKVLQVKQKDETKKGTPSVPSKVTNISQSLHVAGSKALSTEEFLEQLAQHLAHACKAEVDSLHSTEWEEIEHLAKEKFETKNWIFKK